MNSYPEQEQVIQPLLKQLEERISLLALHWRSSNSDEEAQAIAHHYQAILRCMLELGFHQSLQLEAELPDELMPQEYFDLFK